MDAVAGWAGRGGAATATAAAGESCRGELEAVVEGWVVVGDGRGEHCWRGGGGVGSLFVGRRLRRKEGNEREREKKTEEERGREDERSG